MKKLMLFSMWLAASAAAVGVASAGVSVVDGQVVDPPPAAELASSTPGGTTNVNDANEADTASTAAGEQSPDPTANQIDGPANDGGDQSAPSTRATPPSAAPSSTPRSQPTPRPTTSPATGPASTTAPTTQPTATTPPPTPPPTAPPPPAATTQTFVLTGGTTAISFSSSGVEVLWATPNPGFAVKIEPESPGIKVEFRADHHRSRVDAWWSGGPQHSVREEPRD